MKGKLIVIEGTDCSGKETQTKMLMEKLINIGRKVKRYSFPNYDSPTGKIVGGPYLGKSYICDGWFPETAINVDPKVASAYYIADRKYNIPTILNDLNKGIDVILDRYTYSNMAHQGGKIFNDEERYKMYTFIKKLEFGLYELPIPDIRVFLHMPYEAAVILKKGREEAADQHEMSEEHLRHAEKAYLEVAKMFKFRTIECYKNEKIRTIENINKELFNIVNKKISK